MTVSPNGLVELRRATAADVPAIRSVAEAAFSPYVERIGQAPAPMAADHAALVRDEETWVAQVGGAVVGYLVLVHRGDHLEAEALAVRPDRHGQGIGSALLGQAEARVRAEGLAELRLCTNVKMTENLGYYPRRGFVETHRAEQAGFERVFFRKPV